MYKPLVVARRIIEELKLLGPPVPLEKVAELAQAKILECPLKNDGYSFRSSDLKKLILSEIPLEDSLVDFLLNKDVDDIKYFIFVNNNSPFTRKRFTIAHELGHIFLGHFKGSCALFSSRNNSLENEANMFAGEILVPIPFLKRAIFGCNMRSVKILSLLFQVSEKVIEIQVERYNLKGVVF